MIKECNMFLFSLSHFFIRLVSDKIYIYVITKIYKYFCVRELNVQKKFTHTTPQLQA